MFLLMIVPTTRGAEKTELLASRREDGVEVLKRVANARLASRDSSLAWSHLDAGCSGIEGAAHAASDGWCRYEIREVAEVDIGTVPDPHVSQR